jgi:hypothetical protein
MVGLEDGMVKEVVPMEMGGLCGVYFGTRIVLSIICLLSGNAGRLEAKYTTISIMILPVSMPVSSSAPRWIAQRKLMMQKKIDDAKKPGDRLSNDQDLERSGPRTNSLHGAGGS